MRMSFKPLLRCTTPPRTCRNVRAVQTWSSHCVATFRHVQTTPSKNRSGTPAGTLREFRTRAHNANHKRPAPASLAEAVREEEMHMRQQKERLGRPNKAEIEEGNSDNLLRPPLRERKDPDAWMLILDRFLPEELRISRPEEKHVLLVSAEPSLYLLQVLKAASTRSNAGIDLFTHMGTRHSRWEAVIWLMEMLLKRMATQVVALPIAQMPSNIVWPSSLDEATFESLDVDALAYRNHQAADNWHDEALDPRYTDSMSDDKDATMTQIWFSLGSIIIESKEVPENEGLEAMSVVYRIIARIHNSNLVPDSVYSYVPSGFSSSVQRPAILHLLSSRMLTTLSDAVWRSHQDEMIAQAVKQGYQHSDISSDPPGGRFRLKVRPLGAEVWLEFVLWCCVDGGFATAGVRIIERMQQSTRNPWFAINWTATKGATVDWERVRLRHGGTVGLIEGYSSERPFAELDSRTVSTEVVLALVESLLNSVHVGVTKRGSSSSRVMKWIKSVISFLEPHDLPPDYFDYLTVRMAQTGGPTPEKQPQQLLQWANTVDHLRALESTNSEKAAPETWEYDSILAHSELHSAMLHQSLDGLVMQGDIRNAIDVFSIIQQSIDSRKLQTINAFLAKTLDDSGSHYRGNAGRQNLEFSDSFGQLPKYKIAGFLNLVTDTKLIRLGQWLLYSEDPDGPTISRSSYKTSSLAIALVRFAGLSNDPTLVRWLENKHRKLMRPLSVNLLRNLVNAHIMFSDFEKAESLLRELLSAKAGGYAPANLAHLVASILRLETQNTDAEEQSSPRTIMAAKRLLMKLLSGNYQGSSRDFRMQQRLIFGQNVASILRILVNISNTSLSSVAGDWQATYDPGNAISLETSTFNVILAAVVETRGAQEGRRLWDLFCRDPRAKSDPPSTNVPEDDSIEQQVQVDYHDDEWESTYLIRDEREQLEILDRFIPLVRTNEPEVDTPQRVSQFGKEEADANLASLPTQAQGIGFDSSFKKSSFDQPRCSSQPRAGPPKDTAFTPLVVPDLRTLRLIVRGALAEQRTLREHDLDISEQKDILKWATQFYEALGSSRQLIEEETQQAFAGEGMTPAEAMALYDRYRRDIGLKDLSTIDVTKHFVHGAAVTNMPQRIFRG